MTGWGCADPVGNSLTFTVPTSTTLVGVGLINGNKWPTTPTSPPGDTSYAEGRRITAVLWQIEGAGQFEQQLSPADQNMQQVMIPPVVARGGRVTLRRQAMTPEVPVEFEGMEHRNYAYVPEVELLTKG